MPGNLDRLGRSCHREGRKGEQSSNKRVSHLGPVSQRYRGLSLGFLKQGTQGPQRAAFSSQQINGFTPGHSTRVIQPGPFYPGPSNLVLQA